MQIFLKKRKSKCFIKVLEKVKRLLRFKSFLLTNTALRISLKYSNEGLTNSVDENILNFFLSRN